MQLPQFATLMSSADDGPSLAGGSVVAKSGGGFHTVFAGAGGGVPTAAAAPVPAGAVLPAQAKGHTLAEGSTAASDPVAISLAALLGDAGLPEGEVDLLEGMLTDGGLITLPLAGTDAPVAAAPDLVAAMALALGARPAVGSGPIDGGGLPPGLAGQQVTQQVAVGAGGLPGAILTASAQGIASPLAADPNGPVATANPALLPGDGTKPVAVIAGQATTAPLAGDTGDALPDAHPGPKAESSAPTGAGAAQGGTGLAKAATSIPSPSSPPENAQLAAQLAATPGRRDAPADAMASATAPDPDNGPRSPVPTAARAAGAITPPGAAVADAKPAETDAPGTEIVPARAEPERGANPARTGEAVQGRDPGGDKANGPGPLVAAAAAAAPGAASGDALGFSLDASLFEAKGGDRVAAQVMTPVLARPETPGQIAVQVAEVVAAGGKTATEITLQPEELGRLRMSMSAENGGLSVTMTVERPETLDLMRRHIDGLVDELRRLGYTSVNVSLEGGNGGNARTGTEGDTDGRGSRAGPAPAGPETAAETAGLASDQRLSRPGSTGGIDIRL